MSKYNSYDNSTHIRYPDTVNVHEHKAPTDDSIKIFEEMQEKAIKNILAKVTVENNLVNGTVFLMQSGVQTQLDYHRIYFKFKINNKEFLLERDIKITDLWHDDNYKDIERSITDSGKAIMVWYALKMFTKVAFEEITNQKMPEYLLR